MESSPVSHPATIPDGVAPPLLSGPVLARLIAFSFTSMQPPDNYSFRDTFRDFACAYFTLAQQKDAPVWEPGIDEHAVQVLAEILCQAVKAGELAPHPAHPTAVAILTSLSALAPLVADGTLSPTDAANSAASMLFDGLQAAPSTSPVQGCQIADGLDDEE